jgi:FtsH-binding integral membrane protein
MKNMAEFDRYSVAGSRVGRTTDTSIDEGLRAYMLQVYNYMGLGLAITGVVAYLVFSMATQSIGGHIVLTSFGQTIFHSPLRYVIWLAPLGMVFFMSARINEMSLSAAQTTFWIYAALMGLSLSSIFLVYAHGSIARVFFITAAMFGSLSLWGYTTRKDISAWGSFLFMGLIGIILAIVLNIFLASSALHFAISVAGVLIFAGLTAYDTQTIKELYYAGDGQLVAGRKAIIGALNLYLDFINMFIMLLRLFGSRD